MKGEGLSERLLGWLAGSYRDNRTPLLSALIAGLAAHMFMLTNKLPNHDDIESIFGKGATVTSGRWGLELIKPLFPDCSMPWIYGLISILLLSVSACLMLRILKIKSRPAQALTAALVLSFPSLTGTLCFMFTSSSYALAFLFSVLAVYEYQKPGLGRKALAALFTVLCLSVYQAYISVTASLFVLLMIADALDAEKSVRATVLYGLGAMAMMLAALGVYFGVTLLVFRFTGAGFNDYVVGNVNGAVSIPTKTKMAYEAFRDIFVFRNFYVISSELSRWLHIAFAALLLLFMALLSLKKKKPLHSLLLLGLLLLLPLSVCCMYLVMSPESIHTLVVYSFVCVYFLGALVIDRLDGLRPGRDILALLLAVFTLSNVYFANMCYLKLELQYESARSFYTALLAQVRSTEGFDENSRLAVIGRQENGLYIAPELDTELLLGPAHDLVNIYSRENFLRLYLGADLPFASDEELAEIERDPAFAEMSEYPYYGSIKKIGDCIVVKLG